MHRKLENLLEAARIRVRRRFDHGNAWFRLVLLGLLLTIIGTVALTSILNIRRLPAMRIGEAAIVSGMTVGLLSVKITRASIPWDWLASGLFSIGVGQVLLFDQTLAKPASLDLFAVFALGSAAARIWIGLTVHSRRARAWLCASGCAALVLTCMAIMADENHLPLIVALDILLHGIAIIGFGFGLKEEP